MSLLVLIQTMHIIKLVTKIKNKKTPTKAKLITFNFKERSAQSLTFNSWRIYLDQKHKPITNTFRMKNSDATRWMRLTRVIDLGYIESQSLISHHNQTRPNNKPYFRNSISCIFWINWVKKREKRGIGDVPAGVDKRGKCWRGRGLGGQWRGRRRVV